MLPALALAAPTKPAAEGKIEVAFFEPENFTDVRDSFRHSDVQRTGYLKRLQEHIVKHAARYLPPGYSLAVTFTDIDMAGDYEPWLGPNLSDVRIVKSIYPPSADLTFRLVDPEGNVVKEGRRELRDTAFMMKGMLGMREDPLRYEKSMLEDWMREEFRNLAGS